MSAELVERLVAAAAERDLAACLELVDPGVVWIPRRAGTEGEYRGHSGFERFFSDTDESFEEFVPRFELRELDSERVFARGSIHVRGRGSGAETDVPAAGVFEVRDGRVALWHDFGSRAAALAALDAGDVMRLVFVAFNRGDLDELLVYWHEDCTYLSAIHQMIEGDAAVFSGHDGIRRWWNDLDDLYEVLTAKVLSTEERGGSAVLEFEVSGRGAGSGLVNTARLAQVATVRDGRLLAVQDYGSREEALGAVG